MSYTGKILRINLSDGTIGVDQPDEHFYRSYLGGANTALYYMLTEMKPGIDAFDPDNYLIFACSILTGIDAPGVAKHAVISKSPLTQGVGESHSEGFWGPELKFAGYDAVMITGKAQAPVYINILDEHVELKDAEHIWGADTAETTDIIRNELGGDDCRVAAIGKAGENLVRYASIVNDKMFINHRSGLGAVMGSKKLKAIAVRGSKKIAGFDPMKLKFIAADFDNNMNSNYHNGVQAKYGHIAHWKALQDYGILPSYNYKYGVFGEWVNFAADRIAQYYDKSQPCHACPGNCRHTFHALDSPYDIDPAYGAPELEALMALSSNCGIGDLYTAIKAAELCSRYGLDAVSTGATIAFPMECVANNLISGVLPSGERLIFGSGPALIEMISLIAERSDLGAVLAEGSKRASAMIGKGAERFAVHVKGKEVPLHEPRVKAMLALGYAVMPTGPDYLVAEHDTDFDFAAPQYMVDAMAPLGLSERLDSRDLSLKKVRMFYYLANFWSMFEVLNLCQFAFAPVRYIPIPVIEQMVQAASGWNVTLWELMKAGEKRLTLMQLFNRREGLTKSDDWLPLRLMEPLQEGPQDKATINEKELKQAIDWYYEMMGWDEQGHPTEVRLAELDLLSIHSQMKGDFHEQAGK